MKAGRECEEYTQIQGTRTHNHSNRVLNFNLSCSRYRGHLSNRSLPFAHIPSSGLLFRHLTPAPENPVIIRVSAESAGPSLLWRQHLHPVWWRLVFTRHLKMTPAAAPQLKCAGYVDVWHQRLLLTIQSTAGREQQWRACPKKNFNGQKIL